MSEPIHAMGQVAHYWTTLTHFGASSVIAPTLLLLFASLWWGGERPTAWRYAFALAAAVTVTLTSKLMFYGWGIGIAAINFTGVSGHTLLASAVLPLVLGRVRSKPAQAFNRWGVAAGVALSAAVGVSRVVLGAHSVSEIVAGWALGWAVSWVALASLQGGARALLAARLVPLCLLMALNTTTATYLRSHDIEVQLALVLSGNGKPFARHHLFNPAPVVPTPTSP